MITKRIDAITRIPEEYRSVTPPCPKSVKIEITDRCNYRCSFCALSMREGGSKSQMDFGLFQRITKEMREAGVEEIGVFFIGESFLVPTLLADCIRWCKQDLKFPYVFLTTNGSLATPDNVLSVMKTGLDSLKFSVNSADEQQFISVMRVKGSLYSKSVENLKAARDIRDRMNFPCRLYASSIQYDGEQQAKMEQVVEKHVRPFVDEHYWLPLYTFGSLAAKREEELGFRPTAGNQGRIGALRDPLPCWSVFTEGHVTVDGTLSACCFDATGLWGMADLKEVSFMAGWHSEAFQALRAKHLLKDVSGTACENCAAYQSSDVEYVQIVGLA